MVKTVADTSARDKILEAARKIFLEKGMDGARMQDIALEAGINKALLHYYFTSKDVLFEQVFSEAFIRFIPRLNRVIESDTPFFKKIEIFCEEYLNFLIANPYMPLFILNELNRQPDEFLKRIWSHQKPNLKSLFIQIEEEVKAETIRPIHPAHLVMNLMSMCIFPFIGKPMLQFLTKISDKEFAVLMEQRKKEVPAFIIQSIKR